MARSAGTKAKPRAPRAKRRQDHPLQDPLAQIYAVVRAIPRGRVLTYGQIAELAGIPSGHRVVARAMRTCPVGLPWQRVVGKKDARRAQISVKAKDHVRAQRSLLSAEGVAFDANGFISFAKHGWLPT